jgi:3-oxoacyl-[acyl-carrier protein] reductase
MVAGGGAIVNVGSTVIVRGSPRAPQYAAGTYGLPAGKIPGPEDMTGAALFLASGDAHHVTGSYMIADGGYSMLGA